MKSCFGYWLPSCPGTLSVRFTALHKNGIFKSRKFAHLWVHAELGLCGRARCGRLRGGVAAGHE